MGSSRQNNLPLEPAPAQLVLELRELIDTARSRVAQTVNAELVDCGLNTAAIQNCRRLIVNSSLPLNGGRIYAADY